MRGWGRTTPQRGLHRLFRTFCRSAIILAIHFAAQVRHAHRALTQPRRRALALKLIFRTQHVEQGVPPTAVAGGLVRAAKQVGLLLSVVSFISSLPACLAGDARLHLLSKSNSLLEEPMCASLTKNIL